MDACFPRIDLKMAVENWYQNIDLRKLYVSKLKHTSTQEFLVDYFTKYGDVEDVKVLKDQEGNPRGFAFVTMADQAVVDTILEEKPQTIDGQTVFMRRAIPKDDPDPLAQVKTKKLFIGGLNEEATEQDIKDVLAIFTHHPPEQIKLMYDKNTGKFKGFAFALFENEDIVDKLFIVRNCTIKGKKVELKKAEEHSVGGGGRGGARGRGGMRGGRGGGEFRGRGGRGGPGRGGANQSGYAQQQQYDQASYGSYGEYDYSGSAYDYNGYGYGSGGGYGSGYGSGTYGGGYDQMGQAYRHDSSGYGPNRRGRGSRGGGGYHPY